MSIIPSLYEEWEARQPWNQPAAPELPPELLDQMPEPPTPVMPELLPPEPLGFRERLAMGLSQMPAYQPRPYESGGTRFGRGLISGLAGGFSRAGVADIQRKDETRKIENATRTTAADLANRTSLETWRQRVSQHFKLEADKAGEVAMTPQMWTAMGLTPDPSIKRMPQKDFISAAAQYAQQQAARGFQSEVFGETKRHNRAMENRPVGQSGQQPITPGGYTPRQIQAIGSITDNVRMDPDIKDFVTIRDNFDRMQKMAKLDSGQGDLSIIFAYMKVLDPTSVVREQEYNNAAEAIGKIPQLANIPRQWKSGQKLTPAGRQGFLNAARELYKSKEGQYRRAVQMWEGQAAAAGIPKELVLRDYTVAGGIGGTETPAGITEMVMDPKTGGLVPKAGR